MTSAYTQVRTALVQLDRLARRDFDILWTDDTGVLVDVLPPLVDTYGAAAASLSADWYDELRADTGVSGTFTATVPEPRAPGIDSLVGWALNEATTSDTVASLVWGGISKRIANAARDVVTTNVVRDPQARGWMRIGHGECTFCAMIISRGAVFTKATADFAAHDSCKCSAAPAWAPNQITTVRDEFVPSARRRGEQASDAEKARVQAWIDANL